MSARIIEIVDVTTAKRIVLGRAVGRTAIIHALLLAYGERVNAAMAGRLIFHYGSGEQVKPEIVELLEGN